MKRIMPSNPAFGLIQHLLFLLGIAVNPHVWFDVQEIPEVERKALEADILSDLEDALRLSDMESMDDILKKL